VHARGFFWWENFKERDYLENPDKDGSTVLKLNLKKWDGEVWTGFTWLRIWTRGRLL
jgi:hypothetical protein